MAIPSNAATAQVGRNVVWNLAGAILPVGAGAIAMPLLLHGLGQTRLGIFSLALGLIGFSGLLDLGLGRALTQLIASEKGRGIAEIDLAPAVRKTLAVLAVVGVIAGVLLWASAPYFAATLFPSDGSLTDETSAGLQWIAITMPFALPASGVVGALEGLQTFRLINVIRIPIGIALFMVPALIAQGSADVGHAIAGLAMTRIAAAVIWMRALATSSDLLHAAGGRVISHRRLFTFSSWLTVSNIAGPLMVYGDRFYLASLFPPAAVAHYTVPYDATFRLTGLPMAAMNAVFPALAQHSDKPDERRHLLSTAAAALSVLWLPPLLLGILFSQELLTIWLGADFAQGSTSVLKCLLVGIFLNGYAHVPYASLHAHARADMTAKLHLMELPLYAVGLVVAISAFGILGAALAWSLRVCIDTLLLFVMARRCAPESAVALNRMLWAAIGGTLLLIAAVWIESLPLRVLLLVTASSAAVLVAYRIRGRLLLSTTGLKEG